LRAVPIESCTIDSCISQLKAQGPSSTCHDSNEEGEEEEKEEEKIEKKKEERQTWTALVQIR